MTVVRKGVSPVGHYTVEKQLEGQIAADGVEDAMFVFAIPQYCHIGYINKLHIAAVGASEQDPAQSQEMVIKARTLALSAQHTQPLTGDDWDDYMEDTLSVDPAQVTGHGDQSNIGITGGTPVADMAKGMIWLDRYYDMRLGKNAYPTNASKIRYNVECNYKGHARTPSMLDITRPKWLVIGGVVNQPVFTSDKHDAAGGGYTSFEALYEALLDNIPTRSGTDPEALGDTLPNSGSTNLKAYLHQGVQLTDVSGDNDAMNWTMKLSMRLDIYEPAPGNYVAAP